MLLHHTKFSKQQKLPNRNLPNEPKPEINLNPTPNVLTQNLNLNLTLNLIRRLGILELKIFDCYGNILGPEILRLEN